MRDIWNPWHGCVKCSEGCQNCYMYYLDKVHNNGDSSIVTKTSAFNYPLSKTRDGRYKVRSGEHIRVCLSSDFFVEGADEWRDDAWEVMRQRPDVKFSLLTKRPERVREHLPEHWGDGWDNISFSVTCENQKRVDERIPILLELPFKHKGIMCAPFIGEVSIEKYLADGQIEQVFCGGENYDGARPCNFDWVKKLRAECLAHNITFCFFETGTVFIKDGKRYNMPNKSIQAAMAHKSGMSFVGKEIKWNLTDMLGLPIPQSALYTPHFGKICEKCGSRPICNGCSDCGKCEKM